MLFFTQSVPFWTENNVIKKMLIIFHNIDSQHNKVKTNKVKAISGSGGIHYYFKYTDDLETITSKNKAIKNYSIDIRNNGGCIMVPPSKYFNKNLNKEVTYEWENSIFDTKPTEMPEWI